MLRNDSDGFILLNARRRRADKADLTGFTIPELMIATSVFSLVLASAMAIFFIIGHLFFKGLSITQTQQTAKKILDSISADLGASSGATPYPATPTYDNWLCIGSNVRYTYHLGAFIKDVSTEKSDFSDGNFGLVRDTPSTCNDTTNPCSSSSVCNSFNSPAEELLGSRNRLSKLQVTSTITNLWDISLTVAYGDDDLLNGLPNNPSCKPGLSSSKFCAVTTLSTTISQGF